MNSKKLLKHIIVLAILGMLITVYLTYQHYAPTGSKLCNFTDTISCDIVNKSTYSELFSAVHLEELALLLGFDIPVSILGFFTYFVIMILAILLLKNPRESLSTFLVYLTGIGAIFSLYLTIIEAFVLEAWCIFCVTQAIIILVLFWYAWKINAAKH